jgi:transcriptional regulator with XRE-family HTH domain
METSKNRLWVNFGAWYKQERRAKNISQSEAAKSADITRTHLSDIENGNTGVKRDTVLRLADAIGADHEETLKRAGFGIPPAYVQEDRVIFMSEETAQRLLREIDNLNKRLDRLPTLREN